MKNCYLACIVFMIFGCASKDDFEAVYDVPEEFEPIVETFIIEAASRGVDLTINNLIIRYDDSLEDNVCGRSNTMDNDPGFQKIILINTSKCWLNDQQKEALVFHEMGHCILGRSHDETLLPNNAPKSMMVKDDISVYSGCIYALGGDTSCNKTSRREYYLDELFDENTPVPDWAK